MEKSFTFRAYALHRKEVKNSERIKKKREKNYIEFGGPIWWDDWGRKGSQRLNEKEIIINDTHTYTHGDI